MDKLSLSELKPGDNLPIFVTAPITRQTLAVYCGASGDHNPIHVDIDFAKQSGLDDVIAHGMLVMSYCSRALLEYFPQTSIVKFDTRFIAMTHVGDQIRVLVTINDEIYADEKSLLNLAFTAENQYGDTKTTGTATVARPN